ncbi:hypothetical protein [Sphingobium yanoikuyae]
MLDDIKNAGDAISLSVVIGATMDVLPSIALVLTVIWTGMRIIEGSYKFYKWAKSNRH